MEGSGKRDRADDSDAAADAKRPRSSSGRFLAGTVVLFVAPCMGLTQRRVYEDVICKWGGRLHGRLDSTVTHILTTESFPETSAWIAAHVERAPPSVDAQGARLPYPATMHTLEWLHQCVARRTRLAATEFRVRKPESEPRAAVSVATEAPAPPAPPPPSDVGRETPPCECGTLCAMQRAPPGSANAGRPMFVCAKQPSREAGHCRFFEWADEPPRVRAAAYYQRLGLPVPEPPPKRAKTAAASPVRKRKAQPEQQAPQVEEPALEDEAAVDAALLCVVCREPLAEPRTTRCYHTYCGVCVLKLVEAGMACPECRTPLALGELRDPDRSLLLLLDDVRVVCARAGAGCPWRGRRAEWSAHIAACTFPSAVKRVASNGLLIVDDRDRMEINDPQRFARRTQQLSQPQPMSLDATGSVGAIGDGDAWADSGEHEEPQRMELALSDVESDEFGPDSEAYDEPFDDRDYIEVTEVKLDPRTERRKGAWSAAKANDWEEHQDRNHNRELCEEFKRVAQSYELKRDQFRARAYNLAAGTLGRLSFKVTDVEQVRGMRNMGPRVLQRIGEFLNFGQTACTRLVDPEEAARREMGQIYGVGPKQVDLLWAKGIRSVAQLEADPTVLTPMSRIGLRYYKEFQQRIPRAEVAAFEAVVREVGGKIDPDLVFEVCGSYRRGKATCGDIDVLVTHRKFNKPLAGILDALVGALMQRGLLTDALTSTADDKWNGVGQLRAELPHRRIDFQLIARRSWACALLYFTGSSLFNRSMRHYAGKHGLSLSQHALVIRNTPNHEKDMHLKGIPVKVVTEEDVFRALNIPYVPPHKRDL